MTPERAATLLKIPLKERKCEVVVARKELKEYFLRSVHMRYWVDVQDNNYGERITQRHIYEGTVMKILDKKEIEIIPNVNSSSDARGIPMPLKIRA